MNVKRIEMQHGMNTHATIVCMQTAQNVKVAAIGFLEVIEMQIVIVIKPGASIARIEAFNNLLNQCRINTEDFADVIESIDAEAKK